MNSEEFLNEILAPVHEFCRSLDAQSAGLQLHSAALG